MGKGIGKLQSDILHWLENTPIASGGVNTVMIAWMCFHVVKPEQKYVQGCIEAPDPEAIAKYHSSIQSIRRALRTLHERDLVVKLYSDDRRKYEWIARSVYDQQEPA